MLRFQHAMINPSSNLRFQQRLQRLIQEFTALHVNQRSIISTNQRRIFSTLLLC
jgi:hypothetical protein